MAQAPFSPPPPNAADNSAHENTKLPSDVDAEKLALAARSRKGFGSLSWALGPVDKDYGDYALLVCCLVTGMVDAASFGNWAVFVGMQTGNTVILGLSTAGLPANPHAWLTTLVSLASFLIGAFCTFRVSTYITPTGPSANRLWSSALFFLQGLLIILAAALATPSSLIPQNPASTSRHTPEPAYVVDNILIVSLIPPLAFQSGMQIAASRLLGYNELPVNVLTSTYCDLMGDFKLLALNNVKRNRRALAVVLLLAGAIASGWLMRSAGGLESVLWVSGGIKVVLAVVMFFFMPALRVKELP